MATTIVMFRNILLYLILDFLLCIDKIIKISMIEINNNTKSIHQNLREIIEGNDNVDQAKNL